MGHSIGKAKWLLLPVLGGLLLAGAGVVTFSDFFAVKTMDIYGKVTLSPQDVMENAPQLAIGKNIFLSDVKGAKKAISAIPQIADVKIYRRLPDRIEIMIKEHQPKVLLMLDKIYGISDNKVLVGFSDPFQIPNLPIITGLEGTVEAETYTKIHSAKLDSLWEFIVTMDRITPSMEDRISELCWDDTYGAVLYLTSDGIKVIVGRENYVKRVQKLKAIMGTIQPTRTNIARLDLRFSGQVVMRYKHSKKRT